jgi:mannose-1-phosphate guanylyltransferase
LPYIKPNQIFIGTMAEYAQIIKKQVPGIPAKNYSLEPTLRDRGPAIGLACLIMDHYHPNSLFMTAWSDHHITPVKSYLGLIKRVENYLKKNPGVTVTVGIKPDHVHTGFGYIQKGKAIANSRNMYQVVSFKEKPNERTAKQYVQSKNYLWNTGYFAWNTKTLLSLYEKHLPEIYEVLMAIKPYIGSRKQQSMIDKLYPTMPSVDIETGLIEKLEDVMVAQASFNWADIGSWKTIKDIQSKSKQTLTQGNVINYETKGSLIYNYGSGIVTTVGLKDIIVVVTPDAVLVANKNDSEAVKKIIKQIKNKKKLRKYL